ncbi:MAG: hypothetical protein ACI936_000017 [Paraglaciecola sp.]|jgi:hypothetical protein
MLSNSIISKYTLGDVTHYIIRQNNAIVAYMDINSTASGNYWVRHSATEGGRKGMGYALYNLVIKDIYPSGLMPSRECTSGFAIPLLDKLFKDTAIKKSIITDEVDYMSEADEWLDEVLAVNPTLSEDDISALEDDFSYFNASVSGKMTPHPYNHVYKASGAFAGVISELKDNELNLIEEGLAFFGARYDTLDFCA